MYKRNIFAVIAAIMCSASYDLQACETDWQSKADLQHWGGGKNAWVVCVGLRSLQDEREDFDMAGTFHTDEDGVNRVQTALRRLLDRQYESHTTWMKAIQPQ